MEQLGFSGDAIIVEHDTVIKICQTNQKRFIKNINKQKSFHNQYIQAVPIIEAGLIDGKNFIRMPRLKCDNAIVWISRVSLDMVNEFIDRLEQYFTTLIDNSEMRKFDYEPWINKIEELEKKINDNDMLYVLTYLKQLKFSNAFYYGTSHGDLTLTNIFVSSDNDAISIDAIDFLDTFIESPIQDVVKLRQDSFHLFTINIMHDTTKVDHNRVMIMLGYMDRRIEKLIQFNTVLNEYYVPFQLLNLLRIVPYSNDERILNYIKREIASIL
jgi:hypothetical protein